VTRFGSGIWKPFYIITKMRDAVSGTDLPSLCNMSVKSNQQFRRGVRNIQTDKHKEHYVGGR